MNSNLSRILSEHATLISFLVILLPLVIMLPTMIAVVRGLPDRRKIALVNLAGTLFFTPWIAAMAWAVMGKPNESAYEKILKFKRWIVTVAVAGLIGLVAMLFYVWQTVETWQGSAPGDRYVLAPVEAAPGSQAVLASGKIVPRSLVRVSSEVSGRIDAVFVDINDVVAAGQPLARIDAPSIRSGVDQAGAELRQAYAGSAQTRSAIATTETRLQEQRATFARRRALYDRGFLSRADLEAGQAELDARRAALSGARAQAAGDEARIAASRARLNEAKDEAGRTTVVSPVSGTVLARRAEPGQTVVSAFQAEDLFEIAEDLGAMRLEVIVDETEIARLREGQPVTFSVDALPDQSFRGTLDKILKAPVEQDGITGYKVLVDIQNTNGQFYSGMSVLARFLPEMAKDSLWVPMVALAFVPSEQAQEEEKEPCVYVVRDGRLRRIPVKVVGRSNTMLVIRSSQLGVGDQLATARRKT